MQSNSSPMEVENRMMKNRYRWAIMLSFLCAGTLLWSSVEAQHVLAPHAVGYPSTPWSPPLMTRTPISSAAASICSCGSMLPAQVNGRCPRCLMAVDSRTNGGAESRWQDSKPMRFEPYGPGGYAGPARLAHIAEYRIRPGDQLSVIYLVTRRQNRGPYRLAPGDEVLIESVGDNAADLLHGSLERGLQVQSDGTVTVRLLGEVHAAGLTVSQLRNVLEEQYKEYYKEPSISVTPVRTNTLAEDIRAAVSGQSGLNGQSADVTVAPDGTIRLLPLGAVHVQGLSLSQAKREINLRYAHLLVGLETELVLVNQAPHIIQVMGQVANPGQLQIERPTTVLGAIAASGGHLPGGNMRQVVIFRRAEDWRLISTMLDLNGAVLGKRPTPTDEIWVQDGDLIIVPDKPIQIFNNWVQQVFTDGIYGVVPTDFIFGLNGAN